METQTVGPTGLQGSPFKDLPTSPTINCPDFCDIQSQQHKNNSNGSNECSSSACSTPTSPTITNPPSPSISQCSLSPRLRQSPVFFQTSAATTPSYHHSLSAPRSPIPNGVMVSCVQATPHHGHTSQGGPHHMYKSQAGPHHVYTSQHSMLGAHHYPTMSQSWYPSNTIIINPAGTAPGHGGGGGGRVTPVGCPTPGRITPGRITPGRCTPVYTVATKKRYVDIMLASTASTVAIDNKIEQAMDLVKSHLMFAVREEVDVLKERIGELMERINHLEYENTVLRKYAPQEALQQIQQPHGGAPNP